MTAGLEYKLIPKTNLKAIIGINKSISTNTDFSTGIAEFVEF